MNWNDKESRLTKTEAIQLIESLTDKDDPYWSNVVEDHYDEDTDSWPSIYQVFAGLGITEEEYRKATGAYQNIDYPNVTGKE